MANYIEELIKSWADDEMTVVNLRVDYLEKRLFKSYEPNKFINGEFWTRCETWLKNVSTDADRKTLYRLLTRIFYIGPAEFEELFRNAYEGPVARWLCEKEGIDVCVPGAQAALQKAAESTWFCPVTDSFRINSFFHINNLPANANLRPDWCSLHKLADIGKLSSYANTEQITRLVLLEDFVGGGSQSLGAVQFAVEHSNVLDVLFVPMIICPEGAKKARELEIQLNTQRLGSFKFSPVLELPKTAFFTPTSSALTQKDSIELRDLLLSTYPAVSGGVTKGKPYHMYGYPPHDPTGGLVVMYTNTPDNTLPIIHWRPASGSWEPVFPRHSRV
ncbi:MAG: hypothetical protein QHC88_02580 [Achromobacter sp.]|uniref:phosphoribosyltransferase-like protein n=1 Tax=Achromobacter sp. TaxID=134375 RepID=UPI0029A35190|nr:hypothetical protein [Achromobacter sp.]MDX3984117.1 hypothetical protein [Achromobacter sp.]